MQTTKKEKQIYEEPKRFFRRRRTAVELAQLGGVIPHSVGKCPEGTKGKGIL